MLTTQQLLTTICGSILDANAEYIDMSGGWHLQDSGIESFASAHVARSLCRLGREKDGAAFSALEVSLDDLQRDSGAKPTRGRTPSRLRRNGRLDVVYYKTAVTAVGVVELKRHFSWSAMEADVERLRIIIDRYGVDQGGSLRWGCVAGFHTVRINQRKDTAERLGSFEGRLEAQYPNLKFYSYVDTRAVSHETPSERGLTGFAAIAVLFKSR